jgi:NTE family protein
MIAPSTTTIATLGSARSSPLAAGASVVVAVERPCLSVTMDEVARRAGVGVGTVYRRFPDKELLIDALFEQRIDELLVLAEAARDDPDPWQGLVRFCESFLAVQAADRGLKELVLSTAHGQERVARARAGGDCAPTSSAPTSRASSSCSARSPTTRTTCTPTPGGASSPSCWTGCRPAPTRPARSRPGRSSRASSIARWARGARPGVERTPARAPASCANPLHRTPVCRRAGRVGSVVMRVGLVLGAGGVIGGSWLMGALEALEAETGWRAADAEHIVGTSAGAVIGALAAAGVPPEFMSAYAAARTLDDIADAEARAAATAQRASAGDYHLQWAFPPIGPGSWRLAMSTLLQPHRHSAAAVIAGWLPRGFISTAPIRDVVETFIPDDWPRTTRFWAVAADYATGRRVAFGSDDAPPATVGEAVAASCAIPGFYHPVTVAGRRYVDGGICSVSNLDLLRDEGLDLVICLNPMSSLAQATGGSPADRMAAIMRASAGRRLGHEARTLREAGTRVLILQPGEQDVGLMGFNLMSGARRLEVMEQARRSVANELRGMRARRAPLPARSAGRRRRAAAARPRAQRRRAA